MINILCYGDSNTHGTVPMAHADDVRRFGPKQRWTGVMQAGLGQEYCVIEEGLPGRTSVFDDPIDGAHKNGRSCLLPCLESHWPVDIVILMLGVNDLKARYGLAPYDIACGAGALVAAIKAITSATGKPAEIILVAPPPIVCTGWLSPMFAGGDEKSQLLPQLFQAQAERHGVGFLDAGRFISVSRTDGIHFDENGHGVLGKAIAALVKRHKS
jgi:lysophospholipase L1-like esterase